MALSDIWKFVAVDERLGTAGQPTEKQLADVKDGGFELVVNLGLNDPRYCLPDEAGSVAALGMRYEHIPVDFANPTEDDFDRFCQVMTDAGERKVFVHCAMNHRVSCFVALYGEAKLGWSRDDGEALINRLWHPNDTWRGFMDRIRARSASA
jgi:protein tyrosine phosphatase (PTP) superfamily phosphohydrolase (DUF442 family)